MVQSLLRPPPSNSSLDLRYPRPSRLGGSRAAYLRKLTTLPPIVMFTGFSLIFAFLLRHKVNRFVRVLMRQEKTMKVSGKENDVT